MKPSSHLPPSRILEFYAGTKADHRGRPLVEILKWSDDQLESVHDYIQWLFPLQERSGFNVNAPVLDELTIREFQLRPDLKQNLRASFVRMLGFYGLEILDASPPIVRRAPSFAERSENWLTASNHNHLRITRILKSMQTLGLEAEATALFNCLTDIYGEESSKDLPAITEETFRFWKAGARLGLTRLGGVPFPTTNEGMITPDQAESMVMMLNAGWPLAAIAAHFDVDLTEVKLAIVNQVKSERKNGG